MNCTYSQYSLPTIEFVGGETQKLVFNAHYYKNNANFDLSGCTYDFSIVSAVNKSGSPITLGNSRVTGTVGSGMSAITIEINSKDTVNLCGKYIYQISIKAKNGTVEIPKQGVLYITNNINKNFIS